jgi:hypothetical protein
MRDSIEPGQMDEWLAYEQIEPDQEDRLREVLKIGFAALCQAWGSKREPKDFDPWHKDEPQIVSPESAAAIVRNHYGF